MNVLVTGGAGYVGMSLIHRLMSNEQISKVHIYDNLARANYAFFIGNEYSRPDKLRFIQGDLMDSRLLTQSMKDIDVVMHLAAKVSTPFSDKDAHAYDQVNHWGSAQVANAAEENDVRRLIYLSSASVYGSTDSPVSEFYDTAPNTFYGISKLSGEKQVRRLSEDREIYVLRAANVYGHNPAMRIDAVINRFLFLANYHGRISVNGDGSQFRSFIHVEKLGDILDQLVTTDMKPGIYNLAEHNMQISAIVGAIREIYPQLEVLSINHNMPLRSIQIDTACKILNHLSFRSNDFSSELREFQQAFNFRKV